MSENTAQQTHDLTHIETTHPNDFQNLNRNGDLQTKNQKKSESIFHYIPLEELEPLFRTYGIEAAARVEEHGVFEEGTTLLQENTWRNRILNLPESGMHSETPYNMHLTCHFPLNNDGTWTTPLFHRKEESVNAYNRINWDFISQYNLNPLDIMSLPSGQHIPLHHNMTVTNSSGSRLNLNLPTANYGNGANSSALLNMNDVFEAFPDDE